MICVNKKESHSDFIFQRSQIYLHHRAGETEPALRPEFESCSLQWSVWQSFHSSCSYLIKADRQTGSGSLSVCLHRDALQDEES